MATEIEVTRVDEAAAQRLADATGRVVYLGTQSSTKWNFPARMTTDRDEAVGWGEYLAFPPQWPQPEPLVYEAAQREVTEQQADAWALGGNLGELARRTMGERQTRDHYQWAEPQVGRARAYESNLELEPQLRVVRVLEYRGPQSWMEKALANSWVSETQPRHGKSQGGAWEIVEQIRTTERLCRWCGGEHLGQCSEDGCSANPAVQRHRSGK